VQDLQQELLMQSLQRKLNQAEVSVREGREVNARTDAGMTLAGAQVLFPPIIYPIGTDLEEQVSRNSALRQTVEQLTEDLNSVQQANEQLQAHSEKTSERLQTLVDVNRTLTRTLHTAPSLKGEAVGAVAGASALNSTATDAAPRRRLKKKRKTKRSTASAALTQQAASQSQAFSSVQDKPLPWVTSQYAGRSHSVLANAQITMSDPAAVGVRGKPSSSQPESQHSSRASSRHASRPPAASQQAISVPSSRK
jgi:FtsZ-binding cell division protein ZapB